MKQHVKTFSQRINEAEDDFIQDPDQLDLEFEGGENLKKYADRAYQQNDAQLVTDAFYSIVQLAKRGIINDYAVFVAMKELASSPQVRKITSRSNPDFTPDLKAKMEVVREFNKPTI